MSTYPSFQAREKSSEDEHYPTIKEYIERPDWWEDGRHALEDFFGDNASSQAQHQDVHLNEPLDALDDDVQKGHRHDPEAQRVHSLNDTSIAWRSKDDLQESDQHHGTEARACFPAQAFVPPDSATCLENLAQVTDPDPQIAHLVVKRGAADLGNLSGSARSLSPVNEAGFSRDSTLHLFTDESPLSTAQTAKYDADHMGELSEFTPVDETSVSLRGDTNTFPILSPTQEPAESETRLPLLKDTSTWLQDLTTVSQSPVNTSLIPENENFSEPLQVTTLPSDIQNELCYNNAQMTSFNSASSFPPNPYSFDAPHSTYEQVEDVPYVSQNAEQTEIYYGPSQEPQDSSAKQGLTSGDELLIGTAGIEQVRTTESDNIKDYPQEVPLINEKHAHDKEGPTPASVQIVSENTRVFEPQATEAHIHIDPAKQEGISQNDKATVHGARNSRIRSPLEAEQSAELDAASGAEGTTTSRNASEQAIPKNGALFQVVFPATPATRKRKAHGEQPEEPPKKRICLHSQTALGDRTGDVGKRHTPDTVLSEVPPGLDLLKTSVSDEAFNVKHVSRHSASSSISSLTSVEEDYQGKDVEQFPVSRHKDLVDPDNKRKAGLGSEAVGQAEGDAPEDNIRDLSQPASPREHISKKVKQSSRYATRSHRLPDLESADELSTSAKPPSLARPSKPPKTQSLVESTDPAPATSRSRKPATSAEDRATSKRRDVSTRELSSMFNTSSWKDEKRNAPGPSGRLRSATPRSESVAPQSSSSRARAAVSDQDNAADAGAEQDGAMRPVPRSRIGSKELQSLELDTPSTALSRSRRQGAVRRSTSTAAKPLNLVKSESLNLANTGGQKAARAKATKATTTRKSATRSNASTKPSTDRNASDVEEEGPATSEVQRSAQAEEQDQKIVAAAPHEPVQDASGKQAPKVPSSKIKPRTVEKMTAPKPTNPKNATSKPATPEKAPSKPQTAASNPKTPNRTSTDVQKVYPKVQTRELAALGDWTVKDNGGDEGSNSKRTSKKPERFG